MDIQKVMTMTEMTEEEIKAMLRDLTIESTELWAEQKALTIKAERVEKLKETVRRLMVLMG